MSSVAPFQSVKSPPVSVIVLTLNEEQNIAECLTSCAWCDDVYVLDSGSTDGTRRIAESMGAKVYVNPFQSFGQQRNWAIDNIPARHDWHFHLDADERFTRPLVDEMCAMIGQGGAASRAAAYLCPSKMIFLGRWLKYSGGFPAYQMRFFHRARCRFVDFGHGQREDTTGHIGRLKEPYLHYNFSKGFEEWLLKHNGYSDREADEGLQVRRRDRPRLSGLRAKDNVARRRTLKNFSYFLKLRAAWRFAYIYFGRRGVLDGIEGLRYSLLLSMYEYWIELKMIERESRWTQRTLETARRLLQRGDA